MNEVSVAIQETIDESQFSREYVTWNTCDRCGTFEPCGLKDDGGCRLCVDCYYDYGNLCSVYSIGTALFLVLVIVFFMLIGR